MGVTGLWKLIDSAGKPIPLESLENKVLAVDISIWLHQVVKGFQDNKGGVLANAHLLGLFHRLCKLLYYRIKPVFVFDGGVPQLKLDTIKKRSGGRNKLLNEADRLQDLLLQSLAKEKVVQQALGPNVVQILTSPPKLQRPGKSDKEDIFKLPDLPEKLQPCGEDEPNNSQGSTDLTSSDSSFEYSNTRNKYMSSLQMIDVKSANFKSLPADVRHEILTDIRETRKQSSWGRLHELPAQSNDFSNFQMKRLLKRRQVQVSLEEAQQEMGGHSLSLSELRNFLSEEGVVTPTLLEKGARQISSDENTRFMLVRDLKKAVENAEKLEKVREEDEAKEVFVPHSEDADFGLQKAIEMSLETTSQVYDEKDYEEADIRMSKEQKERLKKAAMSLARAYMIEYGGMNDDEIKDLLETQRTEDEDELSSSLKLKHNDRFISDGEVITPYKRLLKQITHVSCEKNRNEEISNKKSDDKDEVHLISDSESESDLVDVPYKTPSKEISLVEKLLPGVERGSLEIVVDVATNIPVIDDIFADIFAKEPPADLKTQSGYSKEISLYPTELKISADYSKKNLEVRLSTESAVRIEESQGTAADQPEDVGSTSNAIALDILSQLKSDLDNANKLTLEELKSESEVIEIVDENETSVHGTPENRKKGCTIDEFFELKFKINRTPKKLSVEDDEAPTVQSPFFVKRSPKSPSVKNCKFPENEDKTKSNLKTKKVAKMLFDDPLSSTSQDFKPLQSVVVENPIEAMGQVLRENKTQEELESLASEIGKEKRMLELERNRQDRMGTKITEKMSQDCMHLLRLFGIPYIVAPMEAEAQCAFLNCAELTDGTITDDSDIWLFGGKTVYKNFFNQNKYVMEFKVSNIEKLYNVDRKKLIQLATLVGSDYTTGINGIGAVTALEILGTFASTPQKDGEVTETMSVLSSLRKFREWWRAGKNVGPHGRTALRSKLKNIEITEQFPSSQVINAYINPKVERSREKFTWGAPDIETIREFAKKNFGWTKNKTNELLDPVIKKMKERKSQTSITNFFKITSTPTCAKDLKVSKRVRKAIDQLSSEYKSDNDGDSMKPKNKKETSKSTDVTGPSRMPKRSNPAASKNRKRKAKQEEIASEKVEENHLIGHATNPLKMPRKLVARIPETKQVIPQKEKDIIEMEKKKCFAAEILKKSRKTKENK